MVVAVITMSYFCGIKCVIRWKNLHFADTTNERKHKRQLNFFKFIFLLKVFLVHCDVCDLIEGRRWKSEVGYSFETVAGLSPYRFRNSGGFDNDCFHCHNMALSPVATVSVAKAFCKKNFCKKLLFERSDWWMICRQYNSSVLDQ